MEIAQILVPAGATSSSALTITDTRVIYDSVKSIIDDNAGDGDTDVVWSADKSTSEITDLKNSTENLLVNDGFINISGQETASVTYRGITVQKNGNHFTINGTASNVVRIKLSNKLEASGAIKTDWQQETIRGVVTGNNYALAVTKIGGSLSGGSTNVSIYSYGSTTTSSTGLVVRPFEVDGAGDCLVPYQVKYSDTLVATDTNLAMICIYFQAGNSATNYEFVLNLVDLKAKALLPSFYRYVRSLGSTIESGEQYQDLDTIPTNEFVYYAGSNLPLNCPQQIVEDGGSRAMLAIKYSRYASGNMSALCPEIVYYYNNSLTKAKIFYRIPWGGSTITWSSWYELPTINDSSSNSNEETWSVSKIKAEIESRLPDNFVYKNLMVHYDAFSYTGSASPSSLSGHAFLSGIKVDPKTSLFLKCDSMYADGDFSAFSIRITEHDKDGNVTQRSNLYYNNDDKMRKIETTSTTVDFNMSIFWTANTTLTYTVEGLELWQYSYNHKYTLSKDIYIEGIEQTVPMSMFQKIGFIGDSYSSASIYYDEDTWAGRNYDLSWGQVLCREIGATGINFSTSGLTTKTWLEDTTNGLQKLLTSDRQQLYYIALGINDYSKISSGEYTLGSISDINDADFNLNADSFYGNYGKIIGNIQTYAPHAKIICVSMFGVAEGGASLLDPAIKEISEHFEIGYLYVLNDPFFISPEWNDRLVHNHPIAKGYAGMARALRRLTERYMYNSVYFNDYFGLTSS